MEFIGIYNGYEVLKDLNGNYVVEGSSSVFVTEEQVFKACMVGDIND